MVTLSNISSNIGGFASFLILTLNLIFMRLIRHRYKEHIAEQLFAADDYDGEEKKELKELIYSSLTGENLIHLTKAQWH